MGRILKSQKSDPVAQILANAATPKPLSAGAVEEEESKRQVAVHNYLGTDGQEVDDEESAVGISYHLLQTPEPFKWTWDEANDLERKMLAVFGAKTLATNESSQIRNNKKLSPEEKAPQVQLDAVKERFGLIRNGQWVDRTREAGAPRVDKDALAEAICRVKVKAGKVTQQEVDSGHKAEIRQKLDDDATYFAKARKMPEVAAEYSAIKGAAVATVDDL